jgi:hypothetical protein
LDVRNIGFQIRKDPRKVNRDLLAEHLYDMLSTHPLPADASSHCHEAKEAFSFSGLIPKFKLRISNQLFHANQAGKISTSAMTIHCDQKHAEFLTRLFTSYCEDGLSDKQFVPHSLLHGNDPTNLRAYRNTIILQNQYLCNVRVLPVMGISPKALKKSLHSATKHHSRFSIYSTDTITSRASKSLHSQWLSENTYS